MDARNAIFERYQFVLPEDYEAYLRSGLLSNNRSVGIKMSRFSWLSPEEIATCDLPRHRLKPLVPLARTPGRDHFCWAVDPLGQGWIADCPRDSNFGEVIAPDFAAFVFRSIVEEFTDSWVVGIDDAAILFRSYVERVSLVMRPTWVGILAKLASRTPALNRRGRPHVISDLEFTDVISREISFAELKMPFKQNAD